MFGRLVVFVLLYGGVVQYDPIEVSVAVLWRLEVEKLVSLEHEVPVLKVVVVEAFFGKLALALVGGVRDDSLCQLGNDLVLAQDGLM